jgi:hypothetical protein
VDAFRSHAYTRSTLVLRQHCIVSALFCNNDKGYALPAKTHKAMMIDVRSTTVERPMAWLKSQLAAFVRVGSGVDSSLSLASGSISGSTFTSASKRGRCTCAKSGVLSESLSRFPSLPRDLERERPILYHGLMTKNE